MAAIVALIVVNRLPPSSLTQGFSSAGLGAHDRVFDARVRSRFPPGTTQLVLTNELARQGFRPDWPPGEGEHQAVRHEGDWVCNLAARVYWRIDPALRVTAVRGTYREEGCL